MPPLKKAYRNRIENARKRKNTNTEVLERKRQRQETHPREEKENIPVCSPGSATKVDMREDREKMASRKSPSLGQSPSFADADSHFHEFQIQMDSPWPLVEPNESPVMFEHIWKVKDEDTELKLMDEDDINDLQRKATSEDFPYFPSRFATPPPSIVPPTPPNTPTYDSSRRENSLQDGHLRRPPTLDEAALALRDLQVTLRGKTRGKAGGYTPPSFDPYVRQRLDAMKVLLNLYTDQRSKTYNSWIAASLQAAVASDRGNWCARKLRQMCRSYIADRSLLPINPFGNWNESTLYDETLMADILAHIQGLGDTFTADQLVSYLSQDDVKAKHGITEGISLRTAHRWIATLGYRFSYTPRGQYVDGHERPDVKVYRNGVFIPRWKALEKRMEKFASDGDQEFRPFCEGGKPVLVHFHDETIFYANDRRRKSWYHKDDPAKPYAKGEGASLMVADFVSAKYGFLKSLDGTKSARRVLKPGKSRDGYFDAEGVQAQARLAMDILEQDYPEYDHVLVYDNATIHLKRADGSPSATKMPRNPSKPNKNWLVEVSRRDDSGKIIYNTTGAPEKVKIKMHGAKYPDGTPQPLYFPDDHPTLPGLFKGSAAILQERGFDVGNLRAICDPKFSCKSNTTPPFNCCCRRLLFNQPDFVGVESILETMCRARGFEVLFLPKFHCELNFIEQCWGYAKRVYRLNPPSSREEDLTRNALSALDAIPLDMMRRFANRASRFMDAYHEGLTGTLLTFAVKKYHGHRVIPKAFFEKLEAQGREPAPQTPEHTVT